MQDDSFMESKGGSQGGSEQREETMQKAVNVTEMPYQQEGRIEDEILFKLAEAGHPCTDEKGQPLVCLDKAEERRLRHKMDRHITPVIAIVYMMCFLDRANIGNARIAGLEKSLKMTGFDYNYFVMAFYLSYAITEMPMTFLTKRLGPGRVLPVCCFLFGILTMCFSFVKTFADAIVVRVILGVFEAPMLPGIAYYLSRFYRREEMAIRVAAYIAAAPMSGALGGLFASAILKLHSIGSLHKWQMIFLVEGLLTAVVGIFAYVLLPNSIEKAHWLSPREKALAIVRLKSENVASVGVVDALRKKMTIRGMFGVTPLLCGVAQGVFSLTAQSIGFMLPTIVKILFPGRSTPMQQLLTAPPYFVATIVTLVMAFVVTKKQYFTYFMALAFSFGILGYALSSGFTIHNPHARYAATFFTVTCSFSGGPIGISWVAANNNSDTERAGALAMLIFIGNVANIASAWTFLPYDAPNYRRANVANLIMCVGALALVWTCGALLRRENKVREEGKRNNRLEGISSFEQQEALGRHHPAFRYHY